eukprot:scaffold13385_cov19-Tisochrysis_lutea.AAC.1
MRWLDIVKGWPDTVMRWLDVAMRWLDVVMRWLNICLDARLVDFSPKAAELSALPPPTGAGCMQHLDGDVQKWSTTLVPKSHTCVRTMGMIWRHSHV